MTADTLNAKYSTNERGSSPDLSSAPSSIGSAGAHSSRLAQSLASTPGNILVVDDNPADLQLLCHLLKRRNFKVRPVRSGELALQAAKLEKPELILLDVRMPGMDGIQVSHRLKLDQNLRDIPIIFISGQSDITEKVEAFQAGGVDYVTKPFQFEEVEARVLAQLSLRRQEKHLAETIQKMRELEQQRDDLTHMVVHDIRTRLFVIMGALDTMSAASAPLADDDRKLFRMAVENVHSLEGMATQLLTIGQLELGQLPVNIQPLDLIETLQSTVRNMHNLIANRRFALEAPARCSVPHDRDLVGRIVLNLISNACKFTRADGQLRIRVRLLPDSVRVEIADDGIGIGEDDQKRIFAKFAQASREHRRLGFGLGLAFCKLAVAAHRGAIGVRSEPGKGSVFYFTIPSHQE